MNHGFIKLNRSPETLELLNDPNAFTLLTVIALRARRTDEFNIHNLKRGQALIGDYKKCGLTHSQYRTAMKHLGRWGLVAFRPTSRGTIATLLDHRVYDINDSEGDKPVTNERQPDDKRMTTNKNEKNEKNEKKDAHADAWRLGEVLLGSILESKPDFRRPSLERWARDMDRLLRLDGRTPERIEAVIRWCRTDPFWSANILSPASLRKHFDRLELEMGRCHATPAESLHDQIARMEQEGTL
ncbi:MAG: hypothetical protein GX448_02540 [Planctomycetes bacterium]|nr:hypothetical protein [Planctomycetota bacterium]